METLAGRNDSLQTQADGKFVVGIRYSVANGRFLAASAALLSKGADVTKRSEGGVIKGGGTREISHRERKMMQHEHRRDGPNDNKMSRRERMKWTGKP
jgi:hypothetical protein